MQVTRYVVVLALLAISVNTAAGEPSKTVRVYLPDQASPLLERIGGILASRIEEYSAAGVITAGNADVNVYLGIKPGIGAEGFEIRDAQPGIQITGNDERGLLYGVGKFLRTSSYVDGGFVPSAWRGVSVPKKPVRGIYLATHFNNYYHEAPAQQIEHYIEDLSLWGTNALQVSFPMYQFNGIDDPNAQAMLARLRALLKTAKDLGLDPCSGGCANEGYANGPKELRADDSTVNHEGYHTLRGNRIYNLGTELCPNKPGAKELLLKWYAERDLAFKDIGSTYLWIWPYDNGGCTCPKCQPWAINGFLTMAEPMARAYRRDYPNGKVVLSTWYFDRWADGEWAGIAEKFGKQRPDWVDYLMVDDYGNKFPEYPLVHGSPGGLPMLNFPEISMHLHEPWGGFGANPYPKHLQSLWNVAKDKLSGGFPYSEGFFEDMNKAICAQLYWDPDKPTTETVREYIAFYFSPSVVEPVSRVVDVLERNIERAREEKGGVTRFVMKNTDGAEEAYRLVCEADSMLPERVRKSWRWRIIRLRAFIDAELVRHEFRVSDKCEAAFRELEKMYHAERGLGVLRPPTNIHGLVHCEH